MQFPQRGHRPSHPEVLLCHRCQKPGHFACECGGERVLPPLDRCESPSAREMGQTSNQWKTSTCRTAESQFGRERSGLSYTRSFATFNGVMFDR